MKESGETTVGVLMGGISEEREISLKTGRAVAEALRSRGCSVREIDVTDREIPEQSDSDIDLFFVALHGPFGEDGTLQEKLEEEGKIFTGSGSTASRIGMDKLRSKKLFREREISTPPFHVYMADDRPVPPPCGIMDRMDIGEGWVVKPRAQGSSIGIRMVPLRKQIPAAVRKVREVSEDVFVEPRLSGPEVTVGILEGEPLPLIRLKPAREFYDFEAKYEDDRTRYDVDPDLPPDLATEIRQIAVRAYEAVGCRDVARVDLMVNEGTPYVLEVNTIPGLTGTSLLPRAAEAAGISFPDLCWRLVSSAWDRSTS